MSTGYRQTIRPRRRGPCEVLTSIGFGIDTLHGVEGEFGDFRATWRTKGSELFINPLMGLYWSFYLDGVAERCLYLDRIKNTHDIEEVIHEITRFRGQITKRPWKELPV